VGALAVILPFVLRKVKDLSSMIYASGVFLLVTLFVLPSDFFLPYIELPFFIFLAYLIFGLSERVLTLKMGGGLSSDPQT